MRPLQWLKNLMLFFPPLLGGVVATPGMISRGILPLAAFCLVSSASYIFNDIRDIDCDQAHPAKRLRPLPSGSISLRAAAVLGGVLLVTGCCFAAAVSFQLLGYLTVYLLISAAYSVWLKNYPIIDLFCISSGFLLRLLAGGEAFGVTVSEWLFLCVFLLAIFLSTGKRLAEKRMLSEAARNHRRVLSAYPEGYLDGLLYMTGSAALVAYSIYVVNRHSMLLLYTVPLCAFGLFRYILRVKSGLSGDPTESLTKDPYLLVIGVLWAVTVVWGIYA